MNVNKDIKYRDVEGAVPYKSDSLTKGIVYNEDITERGSK